MSDRDATDTDRAPVKRQVKWKPPPSKGQASEDKNSGPPLLEPIPTRHLSESPETARLTARGPRSGDRLRNWSRNSSSSSAKNTTTSLIQDDEVDSLENNEAAGHIEVAIPHTNDVICIELRPPNWDEFTIEDHIRWSEMRDARDDLVEESAEPIDEATFRVHTRQNFEARLGRTRFNEEDGLFFNKFSNKALYAAPMMVLKTFDDFDDSEHEYCMSLDTGSTASWIYDESAKLDRGRPHFDTEYVDSFRTWGPVGQCEVKFRRANYNHTCCRAWVSIPLGRNCKTPDVSVIGPEAGTINHGMLGLGPAAEFDGHSELAESYLKRLSNPKHSFWSSHFLSGTTPPEHHPVHFSMHLKLPNDSSYLIVGKPRDNSLHWHTTTKINDWKITEDLGITIGGERVETGPARILVDTGATLSKGPPSFVTKLYDKLQKAGVSSRVENGYYYITRSKPNLPITTRFEVGRTDEIILGNEFWFFSRPQDQEYLGPFQINRQNSRLDPHLEKVTLGLSVLAHMNIHFRKNFIETDFQAIAFSRYPSLHGVRYLPPQSAIDTVYDRS